MKHKKLIAGIVGIVLGVIITFFIPTPHGLTHAGMIVLASLVTANIFWIFNVIPSFATGLLMLSSWVVLGVLSSKSPIKFSQQRLCGLSLVV